MSSYFRVGMIGLDTSHSVEFTRLLQGDSPRKVFGIKVTKCMRFPSPFQNEEGQNARQKQLEAWGVKVSRSFEETVKDVDGLLLEINDPALHWKYFKMEATTKLPIFLDKPLAKNLTEGKKIINLAKKERIKMWCSSALRFAPEIAEAIKEIGKPMICNVYGAMGKAPAGSSLIWYGCHAFEMLSTIMGNGAKAVSATESAKSVVTIVDFEEGQQGIVECNSGSFFYGGRLQSAEKVIHFTVNMANPYFELVENVRDFMIRGKPPVSFETMLEVQAMLDAAEKSIKSGKTEKIKI